MVLFYFRVFYSNFYISSVSGSRFPLLDLGNYYKSFQRSFTFVKKLVASGLVFGLSVSANC